MSLINAAELDTSPPEWLVGDNSGTGPPGILPRIGTGFVWGKRTAGKSLSFGIDLSLAISNGVPFLGHPTIKGKVVYCLGEGLYDLGCRKQARLARQARDDTLAIAAVAEREGDEAARAFAASLPAYTDDNLFVITEPFTIPLSANREPSRSLQQAINAIKALNPGPDAPEDELCVELVIIDAIADFTGRSLSNDASANLIAAGLKTMARELDCFILAIAHPTAKGDRMLGADRILNSADVEVEIMPDENNAPGSPKTASVIAHKSKYGALFETVGYRIEGCEWDEPEIDEDGNPTGETVRVRSATIRLLEPDAPSTPDQRAAPPRPAATLPVLREVAPASRKRTGLRRATRPAPSLATVPDIRPAGTRPLAVLSTAADARRGLKDTVLSVSCSTCSRQAGKSCDQRMRDSRLIPLGRDQSGPLYAHEDRLVSAALAQDDPDTWLDATITALTARPA
jgi:AAA domain